MALEVEIKFLTTGNSIAVAPHHDGTHLSIIYTHQGELKSLEKEKDVCDHYCLYYASSLEGRQQGSRNLLDIKRRPPFVVSECLRKVGIQLPSYDTIGIIYVFDLNFKIEQHISYCELIFSNGLRLKVKLAKNAVNDHRAKALHLQDTIRNAI